MDVTKDYKGGEVATVGGRGEVDTAEDSGAEKEKSTVKKVATLAESEREKKPGRQEDR